MHNISINIVTALNCEAKPLIDFYRLTKERNKPFDYYKGVINTSKGQDKAQKKGQKKDQEIAVNLLVSGLGSLNMSTACGWLASHTDQSQSVWLNVGTAGHKEFESGKLLRVHRVVDISSGKSHYPPMTAKWQHESSTLITVEAASTDYPQDALVDMEGAAFFSSASLFNTTELIQSIKVVSDNESESVERLNATLISQLIAPHAAAINDFALNLVALITPPPDINDYMLLTDHLHCTVNQRQQYLTLISKFHSLHLLEESFKQEIKKSTSMSTLLSAMSERLQTMKPSLDEMVN